MTTPLRPSELPEGTEVGEVPIMIDDEAAAEEVEDIFDAAEPEEEA